MPTTVKLPRQRRIPKQRRKPQLLTSILTTTDFSAPSIAGVKYAAALAEEFHADLTLLHVLPPAPTLRAMTLKNYSSSRLSNAARAKLSKMVQQHMNAQTFVTCQTTTGKPFRAITKMAQTSKVDLVVIATRGNTGFRRLFLGSTAAQVLRHATCPVLTVPGKFAHHELKIKKIVVPTDFSNLSKDALPYARLLAEHFGAEVILVHAVAPFAVAPLVGTPVTEQMIVPMMYDAEGELNQLAREFAETTTAKVKNKVVFVSPSYGVVEIANQLKADLIVLTTHGHTGFTRLAMGSTTEHVVRQSKCPVLVVRELRRSLAD
jgi:nucleotide-binding universal stress UspA family protein